MAVNKSLQCISMKAEGTIPKNVPVKLGTGSGTVTAVTANTDIVVGVSQLDATDGFELPVAISGVVKLKCGASVSKDVWVGLDGTTATKVSTLTLAGGGTTIRQIVGRSHEAGALDEFIQVQLNLSTDRV